MAIKKDFWKWWNHESFFGNLQAVSYFTQIKMSGEIKQRVNDEHLKY